MLLAWPWSISLVAIESMAGAGDSPTAHVRGRATRPHRSAREDNNTAPTIQIAETDDEDGDGPGRPLSVTADAVRTDPIGPLIVSDAPSIQLPPQEGPRYLHSHRLRC